MKRRNWIKELKIGDNVVISPPYGAINYIDTVKRITKTLIITKNESRFTKTYGTTPGDSWAKSCIRKCTEELKIEIQHKKIRLNLINGIKEFNNYKDLSDKQLMQVNKILFK